MSLAEFVDEYTERTYVVVGTTRCKESSLALQSEFLGRLSAKAPDDEWKVNVYHGHTHQVGIAKEVWDNLPKQQRDQLEGYASGFSDGFNEGHRSIRYTRFD